MEAKSIHPGRDEWQRLWEDALPLQQRQDILNHIVHCEFCAEIWQALLNQRGGTDEPMPYSPRAAQIAAWLYRCAYPGLQIKLQPLQGNHRHVYLMAAEGTAAERPEVENLGEAYCPDPDVVLRLMRNNRIGETYVQVVSDNPALFDGVLVQSPEVGLSLVTDHTGCARITAPGDADLMTLKWMLKLPDAEFSLEPLTIGAEPSDESWTTVLDADHGGRLSLTLERQGSSQFIKLGILELADHHTDEPLVAAVSIDARLSTHRATRDNPIMIPIDTLPRTITIRFYR